MYINTRTGQIASDQASGLAFAVDIAGEVERATGVPIGVWQGLYGQPLGSVTWSARVDTFAELATLNAKLGESASYLEKVAGASELWIPGSFGDRLARVVHAAGEPTSMAFVSSLTAVAAPGKQPDVAEFGAEVTDYVHQLTGAAVSFCAGVFLSLIHI